ncbi:MAG: dioxygenase [Sphingobacteriales bacterium]|nr:dioxygenase [Sphingobacteriales bacterium]
MMKTKFHYAFKVKDIESTKRFYHDLLSCKLGRETEHWVDFNFFGHQLSAHVSGKIPALDYCGMVDGVQVPIPHFGCIISADAFEKIAQKLKENEVKFIIEPQIRYAGKTGEQKIMFVLDFSNNPLEFKCFKNEEEIFK